MNITSLPFHPHASYARLGRNGGMRQKGPMPLANASPSAPALTAMSDRRPIHTHSSRVLALALQGEGRG